MSARVLRILVVDDNETVRRSLCAFLKTQADIEVICEASDGRDAIAMARQHRPDFILMDITMPLMNGFDATRIIKQEMPEIEILMVSQHQSSAVVKESLAAGAAGYITKSDITRSLLPQLQKLTAKRRAASQI
jgi:two-component system, NarL family, nitrate/nitrite response regulator NarL